MGNNSEVKIIITTDAAGAVTGIRSVGDEAVKTTDKIASGTSSLASKIKEHWLGISAAIAGAAVIADKAWDFAKLGAQAEQARASFQALSDSRGFDADKLLEGLKKATVGTIDESQLMQKALKAMSLDISQDTIVGLGNAARVGARMMGTSVGEAYDSIIDSIGAGNIRAMKRMMLLTKEEITDLNKSFAQGMDPGAFQGTIAKLVELNGIIKQYELQGKESFDSVSEAIQRHDAAVHEMKETIGEIEINVFPKLVGVLMWVWSTLLGVSAAVWSSVESFAKLESTVFGVTASLPSQFGKLSAAIKKNADDMAEFAKNASAAATKSQEDAIKKGAQFMGLEADNEKKVLVTKEQRDKAAREKALLDADVHANAMKAQAKTNADQALQAERISLESRLQLIAAAAATKLELAKAAGSEEAAAEKANLDLGKSTAEGYYQWQLQAIDKNEKDEIASITDAEKQKVAAIDASITKQKALMASSLSNSKPEELSGVNAKFNADIEKLEDAQTKIHSDAETERIKISSAANVKRTTDYEGNEIRIREITLADMQFFEDMYQKLSKDELDIKLSAISEQEKVYTDMHSRFLMSDADFNSKMKQSAAESTAIQIKAMDDDYDHFVDTLVEKLNAEGLTEEQERQLWKDNEKAYDDYLIARGKILRDALSKQADLERQAPKTWTDGWNQAIDEYKKNINDGFTQANTMGKQFTSDMETALVAMWDGPTKALSNFGTAFLNMLKKILAQAIMNPILVQIQGVVGGMLGGTSSTLGSLTSAGGSGLNLSGLMGTNLLGGSSVSAGTGMSGLSSGGDMLQSMGYDTSAESGAMSSFAGDTASSAAGFTLGQGLGVVGGLYSIYNAYKSGNPLSGALSTAVAGFMVAGPIGAAVGGILGAVSGLIGKGSKGDDNLDFNINTKWNGYLGPGQFDTGSGWEQHNVENAAGQNVSVTTDNQGTADWAMTVAKGFQTVGTEITKVFDNLGLDASGLNNPYGNSKTWAAGEATPEAMQATLQEWLGDWITKALPKIDFTSFQKDGEKLIDTITRVIDAMAAMDDTIKVIGAYIDEVRGSQNGIAAWDEQMQAADKNIATLSDSLKAATDPTDVENYALQTTKAIYDKYQAEKQMIQGFVTDIQALDDLVASLNVKIRESQRAEYDWNNNIQGKMDKINGTNVSTSNAQNYLDQTLPAQYAAASSPEEKLTILNAETAAVDAIYQATTAQIATERTALQTNLATERQAIQDNLAIEKQAIQDNLTTQTNAIQSDLATQQQAIKDKLAADITGLKAQNATDTAIVNEQLKVIAAWQSFLDNLNSVILKLQTSTANPDDIYARLGIQKQAVLSAQGVFNSATGQDKVDAAGKYSQALQDYLSLGQQAYQRPSKEYQALYASTMQQLNQLKDIGTSLSSTDQQTQLQQQLVTLATTLTTEIAAANTQATTDAATAQANADTRIAAAKTQADTDTAAAQARADAKDAAAVATELAREAVLDQRQIDANTAATNYYTEIQRLGKEQFNAQQKALTDQATAAQTARDVLNGQMLTITGGLSADSWLATKQKEAVEAMTAVQTWTQTYWTNFKDALTSLPALPDTNVTVNTTVDTTTDSVTTSIPGSPWDLYGPKPSLANEGFASQPTFAIIGDAPPTEEGEFVLRNSTVRNMMNAAGDSSKSSVTFAPTIQLSIEVKQMGNDYDARRMGKEVVRAVKESILSGELGKAVEVRMNNGKVNH